MNERIMEQAKDIVIAYLQVGNKIASELNIEANDKLVDELLRNPQAFAAKTAELLKQAFDIDVALRVVKDNSKVAREVVEHFDEEHKATIVALASIADAIDKVASTDPEFGAAVINDTIHHLADLIESDEDELSEHKLELEEMKEDVAHALLEGSNFADGIIELIKADYREAAIPAIQTAIAVLKTSANAAALEGALISFAFMVGQIAEFNEELEKLGAEPVPVQGEEVFDALLDELAALFGEDVLAGAKEVIGETE